MPPTLNARGGINKVSAKEATGVTTAGSTGVGGVETLPVAPSTNIPVSAIESSAPPALNIPEPSLPNIDAAGAIATSNQAVTSIQDQEAQLKEQEAAAAKGVVSDNERAIREAAGIRGTESTKRTELEGRAGIPQAQKQLRDLATGLSTATTNLREFDLNFVNQIEGMRVDASKKDLTKRTFNAASAEANLQMAVQRAGMVSNVYAQQASIQILQDNLKGATDAIDKALNSFYEPIRQEMEMEKMFYQRNSQLFDSAQNRAANARLAAIQQEQNVIDRAIMSVDSAVASGYASADDIEKMTALSGDPKAQKAYAQSIIAKGAIQSRILDEASKRSTISNNDLNRRKALMELALAGDPQAVTELGFDPGEPMRVEETAKEKIATSNELTRLDGVMGDIENILGNKVGLTSSSGQLRNATISGFIGGQIMNQQAERGVVGQVVGTLPVVGNLINSVSARNSKDDFLATANRLLTDKGFESLIDINERVRLTPITEMEVNLAFASANALNSAAIRDDKNRLVGFRMSEDRVQEEFAKLYTATMNVQAEVAAISELGYNGYLQLLELQRQIQ